MEPKVRQVKSGNNEGKWEVDFGIDETGTRRRPTFHNEDAASAAVHTWKQELKAYGEFWALLPALERKTVAVIYQAIKARGLTITKVWEDYQRLSKDDKQMPITNMHYEGAVAEWKRRKLAAGKSERYVEEAAAMLLKFGEGRARQNIHEFQPSELDAWIDGHKAWGLSSKKTNMSLFSSLWEVAKAKGWASYNIVDRLEPITRPGPIVEIYSNETTLNLMAAALENKLTQQVVAPLVLGLWGCMRPEESEHEKFGWQFIDLKHARVTVEPSVAKTGDQRVIRLQPVTVEWLKLAKELKNPLPPVNARRLVDACCERIGLEDWIRDGLRKCCATHLRVIYRNDYDVVKDCGNSVRILLKHYAALNTPEAVSLEHWKITPAKVRAHLKSDAWKKLTTAVAERQARLASESATPAG
jgi:hypothetical protein